MKNFKQGSHCPSCNIGCLDSNLANIIADLQQLDREVRKVITQSGGKHPLGSTELMYLPGKHGVRSVIKVSGGRIYID